uniref:Uncharacterized protein n=1 Tax=Salmonella phage vB_SEnST11_KE23 TaxID=3161174 RepID=A0AAU8GF16_9CAUD
MLLEISISESMKEEASILECQSRRSFAPISTNLGTQLGRFQVGLKH